MASSTQSEPKISLKLMVHREKKRLIFAEANSHFVDTLFSFMTLPLGTIVRLLAKQPDEKLKALGSLQNIYKSLMDLSDDYFSTEESKFVMLNPRTSSSVLCRKLKVNIDDTEPIKYFTCSSSPYHTIFSTSNSARCNSCGSLLNNKIEKADSTSNNDNVLLSNLISFIVTDDLRVMPYTLDIIIQLFCDHGITDASLIEERTIDIGLEQIFIILNLVLKVKYPLTCLVFSPTNFIQDLCYPTHEISVQGFDCNKIEKSSKRMILKVILQKSTSRFLFAEADSDFIEFLFNFLEIPLGTVIGKLFNGTSSLQCVDNLYASISNMNVGEGTKSQDCKDMLLQPQLVLKYPSSNQMFPLVYDNSPVYFKGWSSSFTYKDPRILERYLRSPAKFMLMDDLVITPIASTTTVALLTKMKVSLNDVEIHKVDIGIEEGLKILQASLKSVSTLSDSLLKRVAKMKK